MEGLSDPLVSIIIPIYNVEPYIEEALDSAINQTYQHLEIIVINDGSTDGSGEICDRYANTDNRIKAFHQENRGLSAARNVGLDLATGDLIAFLDPDDAYCSNMIQSLVNVMNDTGSDIAVCDFHTEKTEGRLRRKKRKTSSASILTREEALQKAYEHSINSAVWNKVYKKEILRDLRFPEGYVYEGTYTIFDIINAAKHITILENKLVLHRIHSGSICTTCSVKNILDGEYAREHMIEFVRSHIPEIFTEKQYKRIIQSRVYGLMAGYAQFIIRNPNDKEGKEIIRGVLERNAGKDLENCRFLIRAGYQLIMKYPVMALLIYLPYHWLKVMLRYLKI